MYVETVTATTTAQSLASLVTMPSSVPAMARQVEIQMSPGASGTLYVGGPTTVTASEAIELAAGQSWMIDGQFNSLDLRTVWVLASAGTIRVNLAMEVN